MAAASWEIAAAAQSDSRTSAILRRHRLGPSPARKRSHMIDGRGRGCAVCPTSVRMSVPWRTAGGTGSGGNVPLRAREVAPSRLPDGSTLKPGP